MCTNHDKTAYKGIFNSIIWFGLMLWGGVPEAKRNYSKGGCSFTGWNVLQIFRTFYSYRCLIILTVDHDAWRQ